MYVMIDMGCIDAQVNRSVLSSWIWRAALDIMIEAAHQSDEEAKAKKVAETKEALALHYVLNGEDEEIAREKATKFIELEGWDVRHC